MDELEWAKIKSENNDQLLERILKMLRQEQCEMSEQQYRTFLMFVIGGLPRACYLTQNRPR